MSNDIRNVLLIVIDALRTDKVGAYSGGNLTPNIDDFSKDCEVFKNCFACTNATDPSLTTILTGLFPSRHGVLRHGENVTKEEKKKVANTTPFPEKISDEYNSVAIDILERWHKRGFDKYINPNSENRQNRRKRVSQLLDILPEKLKKKIKSKGKKLLKNKSRRITDRSKKEIDKLESHQKPWFFMLHYWETHFPYFDINNIPSFLEEKEYSKDNVNIKNVFSKLKGSKWGKNLKNKIEDDVEDIADMIRKYEASIYMVDKQIGALIEFLKKKDIYDETAIIITSDHGESLYEHDIFFDHHGLYDVSINVPLLIKAPGFSDEEKDFVQHFDIVPTLLDLLGYDFDRNYYDGDSLVPKDKKRELGREYIFTEEGHVARKKGIRTNKYKLILSEEGGKCRYCGFSHSKGNELYHICEDNGEQNNIIKESSGVREELKNRLRAWYNNLQDPSKSRIDFQENEEVIEDLRNLGYF